MKIPYNILIQIKMSVRPYFKGFTLIFFFYNCRKQDYSTIAGEWSVSFFRRKHRRSVGRDGRFDTGCLS